MNSKSLIDLIKLPPANFTYLCPCFSVHLLSTLCTNECNSMLKHQKFRFQRYNTGCQAYESLESIVINLPEGEQQLFVPCP